MNLKGMTAQIQSALGITADGIYGEQTARAILAKIGLFPAAGQPPPGSAFDRALGVILHHEGGWSNHSTDPGGMTNLGVTRKTWETWTGKLSSEAEMRGLTKDKVAPVYRKNYWEKLRCDELAPALALCVFDFGVNAGPARAARYLQRLCGVAEDGTAGPATVAAAQAWVARVGEAEAARLYQEARRGYYRSLSTFATFGRGWLRRVDEVEAEARKLVR
jgi:lysozyme family protein